MSIPSGDWKPGLRAAVIGVPFFWLSLFFLLPFLLVLRISLAQMDGALITPLLTLADDALTFRVHLASFVQLATDDLYFATYLVSVKYALVTASACLAVGYPFAYFMARSERRWQPALLMGVMLPFWTSFLLRVYAWKSLLEPNGWVGAPIHALGVDHALAWLGLVPSAEQLMYSPFSLLIGMVYTYLPFMVLPLYATLSRMDLRLIEAAQDLGATPWQAFWRITVPLSRSGIVAGFMLVFIPCVGEYVIPELLGGPETLMIGRVLWDEFFSNNDWPMASAVAVVMILVIIVPLAIFGRNQARAREAS
ncbi:MAG: ABC transporter permease [Candidatus Accumulibacter sp.]|jgi:putrescine transport system permease protein|nr:ABC transporter permease [Accumulibacter sp.]